MTMIVNMIMIVITINLLFTVESTDTVIKSTLRISRVGGETVAAFLQRNTTFETYDHHSQHHRHDHLDHHHHGDLSR